MISRAFVLPEEGELQVDAVGLACPKGEVFLAKAWIMDYETRDAVWDMEKAGGSWDRKTENWSVEDKITLPAGLYVVYFASFGGRFPVDRKIKVLGIPIGRIQATFGTFVEWGDKGDPDLWGVRVQAMEAGFPRVSPPDPLPDPYADADIRLLNLRPLEIQRARIDLDRAVEFRLRYQGEYGHSGKYFADTAWLVDRPTWTRLWQPVFESTSLAGGADKNREFNGTIRLPEGSFVLTAVTDDSHDPSKWNMVPPSDPETWGIVLTAVNPADRGAIHVTYDAGLPEPAISIEKQGNDAFERVLFSLSGPGQVLVRSVGEGGGGDMFDYSWIENIRNLEPVWTMDYRETYPSGGDIKNRMVEQVLSIPAGDYALCYVTDDSHAYQAWNRPPPWEPEHWGVTLAPMDQETRRVLKTGKDAGGPAVLALAPVRDKQSLVKRFEVRSRTRFELVALGEGSGGEMYDYGWIENDENGEVVWRMEYEDTGHAGGAKKNRIIRRVIELPRGDYSMHYVSDGSHAFGSWNESAPRQPNLWGMSLVEMR